MHGDPQLPAQLVGIVTTGSGEGPVPVPVRIQPPGQRREAFLEAVLDELRPDVAVLNHFSTSWGLTLPVVAPELPLVGIAHSWHTITRADEPETAHERMQRAMDGLATLVVPSDYCLQEGRELGLRYPERTHVIRYPLQQQFVDAVELDQPRTGVVFAGELIPRKNAAALLQAAALLPDLNLTIVGEGAEQESLEVMAAELGIAGAWRSPGSLGPDAMQSTMARGRGVLPSEPQRIVRHRLHRGARLRNARDRLSHDRRDRAYVRHRGGRQPGSTRPQRRSRSRSSASAPIAGTGRRCAQRSWARTRPATWRLSTRAFCRARRGPDERRTGAVAGPTASHLVRGEPANWVPDPI